MIASMSRHKLMKQLSNVKVRDDRTYPYSVQVQCESMLLTVTLTKVKYASRNYRVIPTITYRGTTYSLRQFKYVKVYVEEVKDLYLGT